MATKISLKEEIMAYSIGLAGKGGTGKTTVAGLLIKYLVENGKVPVLAVDADANANLNEVLGLEVQETLGDAREEMKKGVATGMTKNIDLLLVVSDPSRRGIQAAARIMDLTKELPLNIKKKAFLVNQAKENQEPEIEKSAAAVGLELSGIIPEDPLIRDSDVSGKPTTQLTMNSKAVEKAFKIFEAIL